MDSPARIDQHRLIVTINPLYGTRSQRIPRFAWGLALLAVAIQTVAQLTNQLLLSERYGQLASSNNESLFGRANTGVIACSALLVALIAFHTGDHVLRRLLLAASLCFVAVDDASGLHDRLLDLGTRFEVVAAGTFALLLALMLVLLWAETRRVGHGAPELMRAGLVALAVAVATRVIGALAVSGWSLGGNVKAFGVAAEQALKFGGWILVAAALAVALWERARVDGLQAGASTQAAGTGEPSRHPPRRSRGRPR